MTADLAASEMSNFVTAICFPVGPAIGISTIMQVVTGRAVTRVTTRPSGWLAVSSRRRGEIEERAARFTVRNANGRALGYFYYERSPARPRGLTRSVTAVTDPLSIQ